jgi:hypothetical protein
MRITMSPYEVLEACKMFVSRNVGCEMYDLIQTKEEEGELLSVGNVSFEVKIDDI